MGSTNFSGDAGSRPPVSQSQAPSFASRECFQHEHQTLKEVDHKLQPAEVEINHLERGAVQGP